MFCYGRVHTKTIFLGTFFGSSDPTSVQNHTMSGFDEPEDDPFADLNEEEDRLGLLEHRGEEQELDWEHLLPSVDDEPCGWISRQAMEQGSCSSELCSGWGWCKAQTKCSKGLQHDLVQK